LAATLPVPPEPGAVSRTIRKRNRRIAEILRAAAQVLAESGYHALSMERVAAVLDLSKTSLYHYFPSKDALVEAAIDEIADEAIERLTRIAESAQQPQDRLRLLVAEQLRIVVSDYPEVTQIFAEHADWPQAHQAQVKRLRMRHNRVFRAVIEEGIAARELDPPSNDVALYCLHGALNYASIWCRTEKNRKLRSDEIVETVMLMFAPNGRRSAEAAR
jgi:AcrR family transcriptional regulator